MHKYTVVFILFSAAWAQSPNPVGSGAGSDSVSGVVVTDQTPQGGSATRGVFAPVLDSEKRPITAGGFVKSGPVIFEDITQKSGLSIWHHTMGTPQKNYILETTGSGVCLLDYDHDG